MKCRFCGTALSEVVADLGMLPLSNSYVRPEQLSAPEPMYPFVARVCASCFLVQVEPAETPEYIFRDYAYFSSYSDTWLAAAEAFCRSAIARFRIDARSHVVEIASNDGYLLQYFVRAGIPVLGVEPAKNVAAVAKERGVPTLTNFFGSSLARTLERKADLLVANNVLAHVPDLNDFVEGLRIALADDGVLSVEFPHLLRLLSGRQFDTMYHEHLSYFSLMTVREVFASHGLSVVDVEELPTHGGSLRVYARKSGPPSASVERVLRDEHEHGLDRLDTYRSFSAALQETRRDLLRFLRESKSAGKSVAAYGAPAKASTLLSFCGVGPDLLEYTVDRSPHKQGLYVPGVRLPIHAPEMLTRTRPDFVLILPWNLREEIVSDMAVVREWGGRFVVPIPRLEVIA